MSKVLVAMSGGVDSSVAAYLLQQQGYDCLGVTMRLYENELVGQTNQQSCCSLDDVEDARAVCFRLGIRHHVFNFGESFEKEVIGRFVSEYEQGRTPNPCIECNRHLKFDRLLQRARELGCDYIATGHYARITRDETGHCELCAAPDAAKDQSYMLWNLAQEQLARIIFPLEDMVKTDVRESARSANMPSADIAESEDVCFLPDEDAIDFVRRVKGDMPEGDFINADGKILGRHKGIAAYTIGQRRGLGIAAGRRVFVTDIDPVKNTVTVGDDADLYKSRITVGKLNFQKLLPTESGEYGLSVKVRYAAAPVAAKVTIDGETAKVCFSEPVRAAAPGQSAVFYDGDAIAFGGVIEREE